MLHLPEGLAEDLKNTLLRIEGEKKPSTQPDLNPQPLCYEACPLLLSNNRCPCESWYLFQKKNFFII